MRADEQSVISAWFYFLLSGVNVYVALVCASKGWSAFRNPVEHAGVLHPQIVGIAMYAVAALIFILLSARCARLGYDRMRAEDAAEETASGDEW